MTHTTDDRLSHSADTEQAAEFLRLTLAFMGRYGIAPNPVNYSLCYDSVSGHNPGLREALDRRLAGGQFDDSAARELYRRFIWDDDKRRLETLRAELRTLVTETITGVSQAKTDAERSADSLAAKSANLKRGPSLEEMRQILDDAVGETRAMARNGELLKNMLNDTRLEVERLRDELELTRQQVITDALTGLKNRRAFEVAVQTACEHANKTESPLTLLLVDIDNFKDVNDTYGHLVGDKVIRYVGSLMSANVKGKDTVARMGGEEFAVLLPDTPLANAERVSETLRAAIERSRVKRADTGEAVGRVTVSIGVTTYCQGDTFDEFVGRADKALYASKAAGRNRVSVLDTNNGVANRT